LGKSGIKPEQLPSEEDIKKLERRVKSAAKEIVKKKLKGKKR
jgi:DNA-damage-inducible protein D